MKGKLDALTAAFYAITIASAVLIVPSILNYLEFYRAISRFDLMITEIELDKSLLYMLEVVLTFNFTASNPTGFSGLTVQSISSKLYYENGVHSVPIYGSRHGIIGYYETKWWELKNSQSASSKHLEPYQNVTIPAIIHITPNVGNVADRINAMNFMSFIESHEGNINWRLESVVNLSTFLGGYSISFDVFTQSATD